MTYNQINGPKTTVLDYLKNLAIEELLDIFNSSSEYKIQLPGLKKKVELELERRQYFGKAAA
jgi:hypothetical protein